MYIKATVSSLPFPQTSTTAGWLRSWMPTCWWKAGGRWDTGCPPTALCPGTPWTLRESNFPDRFSSSPTTTTRSGVCRWCLRSRWRVWGIWTEKRPRCGAVGVWSAPSTPWFTRPSGRRWTGTFNVKQTFKWDYWCNARTELSLFCFWLMSRKCRDLKTDSTVINVVFHEY